MEGDKATSQQPTPGTSDGRVSINQTDVFKVGVRVPPFWPEEPDIWFAQVEGQFAISGITNDSTKFNYVIGHLDNHHSRAVKDVIINPPAIHKYEKLKSELIKRLSDSKESKVKQLMMHEELGDRKPSQFLRHLQSLAGAGVTDDFMKTVWINRLPHGIQTVLAGQPASAPLDALADLADRANDLACSSPRGVAAVSGDVPTSVLNEFRREIAELRKEFRKLATGRSSRSRTPASRGSRSQRSSSRQRSQSNYRKYPLCWYHSKFGDNATKCTRPCDFKSGNSKGGL